MARSSSRVAPSRACAAMPCITMLVYSASVWAFAAGDGAVDDDLELLDAFSAQVAQHLHYLGAGAVDGGIDDQTTARLVGSGVGVGKLNLSAYEPLLRRRAPMLAIPTGRPNTVSTVRWWNARSPG